MNGLADIRNAIFRQHQHLRTLLFVVLDQVAAHVVNLPEVGGDLSEVLPEFLQTIIQMGQINKRQGWVMPFINQHRRIGNPARRNDVGPRPPKLKQRKCAEFRLQPVAEVGRLAVAVGHFAAIGEVLGAGRYRKVCRRVHVIPPKHLGNGEVRVDLSGSIPYFLALHQVVRLLPELDFGVVVVIPAVAHNAVLGGPPSG